MSNLIKKLGGTMEKNDQDCLIRAWNILKDYSDDLYSKDLEDTDEYFHIKEVFQCLGKMLDIAEIEYEEVTPGIMLSTPCKVGDTIFFLDEKVQREGRKKVTESFVNCGVVDHITYGSVMHPILTICTKSNSWIDLDGIEDFGISIFQEKSLAEKALEKEESEGRMFSWEHLK